MKQEGRPEMRGENILCVKATEIGGGGGIPLKNTGKIDFRRGVRFPLRKTHAMDPTPKWFPAHSFGMKGFWGRFCRLVCIGAGGLNVDRNGRTLQAREQNERDL